MFDGEGPESVHGKPSGSKRSTMTSDLTSQLPDRLLTVTEAAALISLQPRTLYKWAYQGRIPAVKLGRALRFRLTTLLRLMAEWEEPRWKPRP
jgi:excisionase family DNA binding protein